MNEKDLKNQSETNWERLAAMTDEDVDTSDIAPLGDEFFARAAWRTPAGKEAVLVSVDAEVLVWFREQESDFQNLVNTALKTYAETHQQ